MIKTKTKDILLTKPIHKLPVVISANGTKRTLEEIGRSVRHMCRSVSLCIRQQRKQQRWLCSSFCLPFWHERWRPPVKTSTLAEICSHERLLVKYCFFQTHTTYHQGNSSELKDNMVNRSLT